MSIRADLVCPSCSSHNVECACADMPEWISDDDITAVEHMDCLDCGLSFDVLGTYTIRRIEVLRHGGYYS